MVQSQHCDEIRIQFRTLMSIVFYDLVPQRCVDVEIPNGSVDINKAGTINEFWIRNSSNYGSMNSAISESSPQCAVESVKIALYLLHVGLESTIAKNQFTL